MQKINLAWLPQIFENYKNSFTKEKYDAGFCTNDDLIRYQAADELLEIIKNFIKETNELTKD